MPRGLSGALVSAILSAMLDATPDRLDAAGRHAVPLMNAARTLGISRDALRKRLDRGSIAGYKRRGT